MDFSFKFALLDSSDLEDIMSDENEINEHILEVIPYFSQNLFEYSVKTGIFNKVNYGQRYIIKIKSGMIIRENNKTSTILKLLMEGTKLNNFREFIYIRYGEVFDFIKMNESIPIIFHPPFKILRISPTKIMRIEMYEGRIRDIHEDCAVLVSKKNGGIICSNDLSAIIDVFDVKDTLVIVSDTLKWKWTAATVISYSEILSKLEPSQLKNIKKIVIHEATTFAINYVKKFLIDSTDIIWVITSFPLEYYVQDSHTRFFNLINVWLRLDKQEKKNNYNDKYLFEHLHNIYAIANNAHYVIKTKYIKLSENEMKVMDVFIDTFNRWVLYNKTLSQIRTINEKNFKYYNYMYNCIIGILASFVDPNEFNEMVAKKNKTNKDIELNDVCIICFDKNTEVVLCCNHGYCFDCFLGLFMGTKKCGMCMCDICVDDVVIKKNGCGFIDFVKSLDYNDVIITQYPQMIRFDDVENKKSAKIIVLEKNIDKIIKMTKINRVFLLRPIINDMHDIYENIIGYFKLMENGPKIYNLAI